ncbi:ABC transporter ATP-binding protein [Streptomyces sp. CBMA156]|uniref:ABC transporter ATP-binding protein n=1 Tax=Streptomyces sp. CBMA156 TaxID=1930280 RepID=UPI001DB3B6B8|nr:ATP-binding cassette domain-containing protein [Streptomyces sp. CBMA156]MBD0673721.1 ABC transporter ATP-binding protein [Streptomyces sp. CBMA156]
MRGQPVLEVSGLTYEAGERHLLKGVDLIVAAGRAVAVMGPSGSGKSTLLSLLLGLLRPRSGEIRLAGRDLARLRDGELAAVRREAIGMVFQSGELLPELTPVENVALAALLAGVSPAAAYREASSLLEELWVDPDAAPTSELSCGERQRLAVARALTGSPVLLLVDDPTGALDGATRDRVADLLFAASARRGCAMVVATHDPSVAVRADRVVELRSGRLVELAHGGVR